MKASNVYTSLGSRRTALLGYESADRFIRVRVRATHNCKPSQRLQPPLPSPIPVDHWMTGEMSPRPCRVQEAYSCSHLVTGGVSSIATVCNQGALEKNKNKAPLDTNECIHQEKRPYVAHSINSKISYIVLKTRTTAQVITKTNETFSHNNGWAFE